MRATGFGVPYRSRSSCSSFSAKAVATRSGPSSPPTLVLLTPGKTPKSLAFARVGSTFFGVVLLAVVSLVVPDRVFFSFGIVILFAGIGLSPPFPNVGGGLRSIGSILMAGAPTGAFGKWAERRLVDTVVGCAVALVATYSLWPRDKESKETVSAPAT
jgi:uncharacterized membrane protein YccC